jgi:hypothetical protein
MSALPWRAISWREPHPKGFRPSVRPVPGIIPVPLKDACRVYPARIAALRARMRSMRLTPAGGAALNRQIAEMERRMSLANCPGFRPTVVEGTVEPQVPIIAEGSVPAPSPLPPRPFIQRTEKLPRWIWAVGGLMVLMILKK